MTRDDCLQQQNRNNSQTFKPLKYSVTLTAISSSYTIQLTAPTGHYCDVFNRH